MIKQTKVCTKCKEEKDLSEFSNLKSGKQSCCKKCMNAYYLANREKFLENAKIYIHKNKELINQKTIAYRRDNKEKIKIINKNYRNKNKELIKEKSREYYQKTKLSIPSRCKEYTSKQQKKFYINHKDKLLEISKKYFKTEAGRASQINTRNKRRAYLKLGDVKTEDLLHLQQNAKKCYWCNASLKNKIIHIDHYEPLSKGGEHTLSNLVISCSKCNLHKHTKDPTMFANSIGKLL